MHPGNLAELTTALNEVDACAAAVWAATADPCRVPPCGGWSVAQCLSHLELSTRAYLPAWRSALADPAAPRRTGAQPLRLDLWGRLLAWFLEPPAKIRFPTKAGFEGPSSAQALEEFAASQRELREVLERSEGLAVDRIVIRSAFDSRVRYSIWSSFVVTLAHQRRHLWQAEKIQQRLRS